MIGRGSGTVDSRVVEMSFDNSNFESGAKQSLSTLDRLKQALDFSKHAKSFDEVSNGIRKVNVNPLANGLLQVQSHFSALEVVGMRVLSNLTDKAMAATEHFVKSLSVDQVSAGWEKYANKTEAVQTIMAATADSFKDQATQMKFVNEQMEKLNWFTDETSYNFVDMVSNIGKFTSNQIPLEEAVTSMEGISTWAAISGANVQQASRAMYNLSQAIGMGSVRVQDWMSIENANMATAEFKQTVIDTAVELGALKKSTDGVIKTLDGKAEVTVTKFRETLQKGWFNSDVLTKSLEKYGKFTDELNKAMNQLDDDLLTSDILSWIDEFKEGTLDIDEASEEAGVSAAELSQILTHLGSDELAFGRKAFEAAQEAKTFSEAIEAAKDAASTTFMNIFETLFGNYLDAKGLWTKLANDLWDVFVGPISNFEDTLSEAFDQISDGAEKLTKEDWQKVEESGIASPTFVKKLRESASSYDDTTKLMISDQEWLNQALENGTLYVEELQQAYGYLFNHQDQVDDAMYDTVVGLMQTDESFQKLLETVSKYEGKDVESIVFGNHTYDGSKELEQTLDEMLKQMGLTQAEGDKLVAVLHALDYFAGMTSKSFAELSDEELKAAGFTDQEVKSIREAIDAGKDYEKIIDDIVNAHTTRAVWTDTLTTSMDVLKSLALEAQRAFAEIFTPATSEDVNSFIKTLNDMIHRFQDLLGITDDEDRELSAFGTTVKAVFAIFDIFGRTIKDLATGGLNILHAVLEGFGLDVGNVTLNVANLILRFREWLIQNEFLSRTLNEVARLAGIAAKHIHDWFVEFKDLPIVNKYVKLFKDGFGSAFKNLPDFFTNLSKGFKEFVADFKELGSLKHITNWQGIEAFSPFTFIEKLQYLWESFSRNVLHGGFSGFSGIGKIFSELGTDLQGTCDKITETIKNFLDGIGLSFEGSKAEQAAGYIKNFFKELTTGISDTNTEFEKTGFKGIFGTTLDILKKFVEFATKSEWAPVVKLLGSMFAFYWILKKISGLFKQRFDLLGRVGRLMDAVSGIGESVKSVANKIKQRINIGAFKQIALAIALIVGSMWLITKMTPEEADRALTIVGAIALCLTGIVELLAKTTKDFKDLKGVGMAFAGIGVAIFLMVQTLKIILDILHDPSVSEADLNQAYTIFGIFGGIIAAVAFALSRGKHNFKGSGLGIAAIGVAILLMGKVFKELIAICRYTTKEELQKCLGIMIVFGAILAVIAGVVANGKNKMKGSGAAFAGIAAAMYIMVLAMKKIVDLLRTNKKGDVWQAVGIIAIFGIILGAIASFFNDAYNGTKGFGVGAGFGFVLLAASFMILVAALGKVVELINKYETGEVWQAVGIISIFMILMGLIGVLTGMLGTSFNGWDGVGYLLLALGIGALMLAFGKLVDVVKEHDKSDIYLAMGIVAEIMGFIAGIIGLSKIPGDPANTTASIVAAGLVLAGVGVLIYMLTTMTDIEKAKMAADGIAEVLIALAAMMAVFTLSGLVGPATTLLGAGTFAAIITVLTGLAELIGFLKEKFPEGYAKFATHITDGFEMLGTIAEGIGEIIGKFFTGLGVGSTEDLDEIAQNIEDFFEAMKPLEGKTIDLTAIDQTCKALSKIAFTEAKNAIADFVNGGSTVDEFAGDLHVLIPALQKWAEASEQLSSISINAEELNEMVESIRLINVTGWDSAMAELFDFNCEDNVDHFSDQLRILVPALEEWANTTADLDGLEINAEALNNMIEAIGKIETTELKSFWKEGFGFGGFGGEGNIEHFKAQLKTLGEALLTFSVYGQSEYMDTEAITSMSETLLKLADFGKSLKGMNLGGMFKKGDFDKFGDALASIGISLSEFSKTTVDTENLTDLMTNVSDLQTTLTDMSSISLEGNITDTKMVHDFCYNVGELVKAINKTADVDTSGVDKFVESVNQIGEADISNAVTALTAGGQEAFKQGTLDMQNSGSALGGSVAAGMKDSTGEMEAAAGVLVASTTAALDNAHSQFESSGKLIIAAIAAGVVNNAIILQTAVNGVCSNVASNVDTSSSESVGLAIVSGIAVGVSKNQSVLITAAVGAAVAAYAAAKAALQINSPSKLFMTLGSGVIEGFAKGINDNRRMSDLAAEDMADSSVETANRAISRLRDVLTGSMDGDPVIRPVLDLSEIQNGASAISDILGDAEPLTSNFEAISENVRDIRRRATNDDIMSALTSIGAQKGGDTYIIEGVTYDDGSNITNAVKTLVHGVKVGRRA